ncbi:MAG: hypothetical protein WCT04_26240 [Planctomycetota bacterium]
MPKRRMKRPTGVKHPNATLTKAQVSKIWKLAEENGWGSRRIAAALNLPENKRGVVEKVLYGISYREFLPESKKPRGLTVNDRGDEIHVFDCASPDFVVVIRDGKAVRPGYSLEYPVPNVAALTLRDFAAILQGFGDVKEEQCVLKTLESAGRIMKRRRELCGSPGNV